MVSNLDELGELLENHKMTVGDMEYIVNYLITEDISPQLAMRRIKSFEQLREKIEKNADQEKVDQLKHQLEETQSELKRVQTELTNLQNAKTGLEHEKQELESKSEILDSEREELQRQLQLLQEMQLEDEDENSEMQTKVEVFMKTLNKVANQKPQFSDVLMPIISNLEMIIQSDEEQQFSQDEYINILDRLLDTTKRDTEVKATPQETKTHQIKTEMENQSSIPKTESKRKKQKKEKEKEKETEQQKKANQVINLFMEFINEAEADKSFQERVATICDMDEAYEYLGSIGLSQVYSFTSKGLDKKEELMKLFESWKREGVPR